MIRLVSLALVLSSALPAWAADSPPAPVCARPHVLEAVAERLHRAGQAVRIEAGSVGQAPGQRADIVQCAVRVHTVIYDTPRFGTAAPEYVTVYHYALQLRRDAIFMLPDL